MPNLSQLPALKDLFAQLISDQNEITAAAQAKIDENTTHRRAVAELEEKIRRNEDEIKHQIGMRAYNQSLMKRTADTLEALEAERRANELATAKPALTPATTG